MGSIEQDPEQRRRAVTRLEQWYASRLGVRPAELADWEKDEAFVELALTSWPLDMEMARTQRYTDSARSRMRLRYEGYACIMDARDQIEALAGAAEAALRAIERGHRK